MRRTLFAIGLLVTIVTGALAGCGNTPEPTAPPPTATDEPAAPATAPPASDTPAPAPATATATAAGDAFDSPLPTAAATATSAATATRAATATGAAATTGPATATEAAPAPPPPTDTPQPPAARYPAPTLAGPDDGAPFGWGNTVLLAWNPVGDLAEDEYYRVQLDAYREVNGEPWYGDYLFTKETSFLAAEAFLAPFHPSAEKGRAVVYWWVDVVQKTGEDENGKPLGDPVSPPSEKRTFVTEPKPDGG